MIRPPSFEHYRQRQLIIGASNVMFFIWNWIHKQPALQNFAKPRALVMSSAGLTDADNLQWCLFSCSVVVGLRISCKIIINSGEIGSLVLSRQPWLSHLTNQYWRHWLPFPKRFLLESHPDVRAIVRDRRVVFGRFSGLSLDGEIVLYSGEVVSSIKSQCVPEIRLQIFTC